MFSKNNIFKNQETPERRNIEQFYNDLNKTNVFKTIDENLNFIKNTLGSGIDLKENIYEIFDGNAKAAIVYIDSIADKELIMEQITKPLLESKNNSNLSADNNLIFLQMRVLSVTDTKVTNKLAEVINKIMYGDAILFIDGAGFALIAGSRKAEKKAIEKPENEESVLGSQESFTDDLKTNLNLVLKRLPVPELQVEEFTVGTLSRTKIKFMWIKGIAKKELIDDVRSRIQKIQIDNVDGIGMLAELIEDSPSSVFPKYRQTERPDVTANMLSAGRIAIICSNSPFAFIAPIVLWDNFKTMDDYDDRSTTASYLRFVRFIAFMLSIIISPAYLSFVTYNHAIVPPTLALNIAAGREGVPFPSVVELLILSFGMSVIREAGLRMPGSVGYFVGTLAAVLIGQAIVTAGYVSASLIIVVAISTIASFAISSSTLLYASRLINYFLILLSGFFGMFGLINGLIILYWHLIRIQSFGTSYLSPVVPFDWEGFKDIFIRSRYSVLKNKMKLQPPDSVSKYQ